MYQEILDNLKPELEKALADLKEELMKIRASRLSPSLIEDLKIECFGTVCPLKQLGAISSASFKEVMVQLWDKSYIEGVVRALEQGDWGFGIRVDENKIYLTAPALTEETRKNLIKVLHQRKEEALQNFRKLRDKAWSQLQDGFRDGTVREDDKFKGRDKLDDMIKDWREKVEELSANKEKEILG
ncbi:MAG: ribosome-recycling factor [Candidatus Pacebacteria bacterium]|nr:ribosome-recycling factor [Candidatus Paceibacterota bacterium]